LKTFLSALIFSLGANAQIALPNLEGHYKSDGKFDITAVVEKIEVQASRNIDSQLEQLKKDGYLCLTDGNPEYTCYKYLFKNEISANVANLLSQKIQKLIQSDFTFYSVVDKICDNQTDQKCKVQQKMMFNQMVAYDCEYDYLSAQQNWQVVIKERNELYMTKIQPFAGYLRVSDLNTEIQSNGRGYLGYYVSNFFRF
jgi:hypothetical protein